jgi:MFS family permease
MIFLRFGLIILSISMAGFGIATYIPNGEQKTFLACVFVCRGLQGAASAINDTTILSISGVLYKDHQDLAIAFILMFSGFAYTVAPLVGSVFYKIGPMAPYWVLGGIQLVFASTLSCFLSKDVNNRIMDSVMSSRKQSMYEDELEEEKQRVNPNPTRYKARFIDYFLYPKIFFAMWAGTMFQYTQSALEPVFVYRL